MIRQLTADEQHQLGLIVNVIVEGRGSFEWSTVEGIFPNYSAQVSYLTMKTTLIRHKKIEEIEEDNTWERHWAQEGLPRSPFDAGWQDTPLDGRTGQYLEDIGSRITPELRDTLAEGTADRLDFARNVRRSRGRKSERTK